jgi:formylglycine-generating enzyme required for sulfatase activity
MAMQAGAMAATAALCALGLACSGGAKPRAQALIVVDTNLPVPGQLLTDTSLSFDATVDTVRVDAVSDDGAVIDFREFLLPDATDWPVSFGIASGAHAGQMIRVRIRAFRASLATAGNIGASSTLEPPASVTVDRLIELPLPRSGMETYMVVLDGDCMGIAAGFMKPATTCIDASRKHASAGDAFVRVPEARSESLVGTWQAAHERTCAGKAAGDSVCIPGGFTLLGDPTIVGFGPGASFLDAAPQRPVALTPFWMDRLEVTVGRYRQLRKQQQLQAPAPQLHDPANSVGAYCTWLGDDLADNDAMPLNCISFEAAQEVCKAAGGSLPSEAQWEHAARGRGQARRFPWGSEYPGCCTMSAYRLDLPGQCNPAGPQPAGSHPLSKDCTAPETPGVALGDVSRDGVLDLGGSMMEVVLDSYVEYSAPCWSEGGTMRDPVCVDSSTIARSARGSSWAMGMALAQGAMRMSSQPLGNNSQGLRCVYAQEAP